MKRRRTGLVPIAALVALAPMAGCSDGGAARALEVAAPFRDEHRRFAVWAERTLESERGRPRSRANLEETLFAPLLLESGVFGAVVTRGEDTFVHGEPIPDDLEWQTVREGGTELRVATTRLDDQAIVVVASDHGANATIVAFRTESGASVSAASDER